MFHPPTSNRSTLRNFLVHVQGALTPHRQRNGEERKELKKLKTYATANIKDERIMCVCGTAEGWYVALTGGVTVAGVLKA